MAVEVLPDYYSVLGVPPYMNVQGIRRAYVRKSWQFHPDLHPDDPNASSQMSDINVAYATLSDPTTRARYDARRHSIRIRVSQRQTSPASKSCHRHRTGRKREPGIFGSAFAMFSRLIGYVAAILLL